MWGGVVNIFFQPFECPFSSLSSAFKRRRGREFKCKHAVGVRRADSEAQRATQRAKASGKGSGRFGQHEERRSGQQELKTSQRAHCLCAPPEHTKSRKPNYTLRGELHNNALFCVAEKYFCEPYKLSLPFANKNIFRAQLDCAGTSFEIELPANSPTTQNEYFV